MNILVKKLFIAVLTFGGAAFFMSCGDCPCEETPSDYSDEIISLRKVRQAALDNIRDTGSDTVFQKVSVEIPGVGGYLQDWSEHRYFQGQIDALRKVENGEYK